MSVSQPTDELEVLPPPEMADLLQDIGEGLPPLVPKSIWEQAEFTLTIPPWKNSNPTPALPEFVDVYINSEFVGNYKFTAPIKPEELELSVSTRFLTERDHAIHYEVTLGHGSVDPSLELIVSVDKTPPVLNQTDDRLIFPQDIVLAKEISAHYLETHDDRVIAKIPDYVSAHAGDRFVWFWDREMYEYNDAGEYILPIEDIANPVTVIFEGDMLRARGDGIRFASYYIEDRTGNRSAHSRVFQTTAAVQPVPRNFPAPVVTGATGSGGSASLNPVNFTSGTTAVIPAAAVIYPDEEIWLVWGEKTSALHYRVQVDFDKRSCDITAEMISVSIGREGIPVRYEVLSNGATLNSNVLSLSVQSIPDNRFPTPQCEYVTGNMLSLSKVPAGGAPVTLAPWILMSTRHKVRLIVRQLQQQFALLYDYQVTVADTNNGIGHAKNVVIPKTFLNRLLVNQDFSVEAYISFDDGESWTPDTLPNFPVLRPKLIS